MSYIIQKNRITHYSSNSIPIQQKEKYIHTTYILIAIKLLEYI